VGENPVGELRHCQTEDQGSRILSIQDNQLGNITEINFEISTNHNRSQDSRILVNALPKHINETRVLYAIDPKKDVDGFHPVNVGKLMIGEADYLPCTPAGIQQLLIRSGVKTDGAEVVVVGRSNIVGKPTPTSFCKNERPTRR
jgi:methylenetetrahydrofolate dehydrogenase (NADP+)/methenyltetrahydrofolate cyclohydrolase